VKTYRNVGTSTIVVDGSHAPGSVFTVEMPPSTETFLTQIGAIVEVIPDPDPVVPDAEEVVAPHRRLHRKKEEQ